jgi:hypothetical protein
MGTMKRDSKETGAEKKGCPIGNRTNFGFRL